MDGYVPKGQVPSAFTYLRIEANESLDDVHAKLWIVQKRQPDYGTAHLRRCRLSKGDYAAAARPPPTGIGFWFSHIPQGESVSVEILWDHAPVAPIYAMLQVESAQGTTNLDWHHSGTVPEGFHWHAVTKLMQSEEYEVIRLVPNGGDGCWQL